MQNISAEIAQTEIHRLINQVAASHEPIQIAGTENTAVLIAESHWRAIEESLHLLSIPGMRESILEGLNTPLSDCSTTPPW